MLTWLIEGGVGPALVGLPVNWAGKRSPVRRNGGSVDFAGQMT